MINVSTLDPSVISTSRARVVPFNFVAAAFDWPKLREQTRTIAPLSENSFAISKPIPLLEPVTMTTLSKSDIPLLLANIIFIFDTLPVSQITKTIVSDK